MTSPGIERVFDGKAIGYESDRLSGWYKAQAEAVLEAVRTERLVGPVLDVGCGTGWLLRRLVSEHSGAVGIGVDLSGKMVELARRRALEAGLTDLRFVRADWESDDLSSLGDSFARGTIGLTVCVSSFHYFANPRAALSRILRSLRPGGRLLLLDRARERSPMTALWDLAHRHLIRDDVRFYRTAELQQMLGKAGFVAVEVPQRIDRFFWRGKLHSNLILISAERPRTSAANVAGAE